MEKQKRISTLVGVIIIVIVAVILFGGVFVYQYFSKSQIPSTKLQTNSNVQNQQSTNQPTITITSPILRYGWAQGSTQNITWTSVGVKTISIDLVKGFGAPVNGSNLIPIASYIPASSDSYSWTIPLAIPVGDPYNIQISDKDIGHADILSDSVPISILVLPSITVISPTLGEIWHIGTTQTIKYSTVGIGGAGTCVDAFVIDSNGNKTLLSQSNYIGIGEREGITFKLVSDNLNNIFNGAEVSPGTYKVELDVHYCAESNNAFITSGASANYFTITK